MKLWTILIAALLFALFAPASRAAEEPFKLETRSKQTVEGFKSSFTVPENRNARNSRMITLHYVRLPATGEKAGPSIVYLAGGLIADPKSAALLLEIYRALDRNVEPPFARIPRRMFPESFINPAEPIALEGMPVAMDIASGMTSERRAKIADQKKTAIFGPYLDESLLYDGMAPDLDLGDAFRAKPVSNVPVLVLSGTLDGRTTIESQREAVSELQRVTLITVQNGGHNLIDEPSDPLRQTVDSFLDGKPLRYGRITLELPSLAPQGPN